MITPAWAELGLYLPWFPLQFDNKPSDLTFTLKVITPPGFQVSSFGRSEQLDGAYYFNWPHPTNEIVVAAGPNLQTRLFESETSRVILATSTFGEQATGLLGEDMLWVLERLSGWFGPVRPGEFTLIESPRPLGGGYSRRGMAVLGGLSEEDYLTQRPGFLRYLAHEAAHSWWWEAPTLTWEDWLNESFAEYSALLALRERHGPEIFDRALEKKRERVPEGLPLWEFERADTTTPEKQAVVERLLYDKGPLLLHELAQRISLPRFLELCRARLWSGVTDTEHLLALLEELEDPASRQWLENQLRGS